MNGNTCQFMEVLLLLRDCHFTWSSEPREGPAVFRAKAVLSFLSYFKTLSIGPPRESNCDLLLCSQAPGVYITKKILRFF